MRHSQMAEKTRKAHLCDAIKAKRTSSGLAYNAEQDKLGVKSVRGTECNYIACRKSYTTWQGGTQPRHTMTLAEAEEYLSEF